MKYGLKKVQTSLYRMAPNKFRYLEPFRRQSAESSVSRTLTVKQADRHYG